MEYKEVLSRLAPCGLDCSRCADYKEGEIKLLSENLLECLGNYKRLARLKADQKNEFSAYPQFEAILNSFSNASCSGCRGEDVQCPINCKAKTCHKEMAVDFCFQCVEYPCDDQSKILIGDRWKEMNDRMKAVGVVRFYYEQDKLPRY